MKYLISFFLICISPVICLAQCLSGNCKNGYGKYDYSYAIYEGSFKNGEPDGSGVMDYGGGEKYMGDFVQGKENGSGLMYRKDGSYESVKYDGGKLLRKEKIIITGGNVIVEGCISGNCIDNISTLLLLNGDKYIGSFKNNLPNGQGKVIYASGNIAEGTYSNAVLTSGTFKYASGQVFSGTFNEDGTPKTGKYIMSADGDEVVVSNNTISSVRNTDEEKILKKAAEIAEHKRKFKNCTACNGKGGEQTRMSWKSSKKTYTGTLYDEYEIKTNYGPPQFNRCLACWGKGEVKR